jgi:hypothetical protein
LRNMAQFGVDCLGHRAVGGVDRLQHLSRGKLVDAGGVGVACFRKKVLKFHD